MKTHRAAGLYFALVAMVVAGLGEGDDSDPLERWLLGRLTSDSHYVHVGGLSTSVPANAAAKAGRTTVFARDAHFRESLVQALGTPPTKSRLGDSIKVFPFQPAERPPPHAVIEDGPSAGTDFAKAEVWKVEHFRNLGSMSYLFPSMVISSGSRLDGCRGRRVADCAAVAETATLGEVNRGFMERHGLAEATEVYVEAAGQELSVLEGMSGLFEDAARPPGAVLVAAGKVALKSVVEFMQHRGYLVSDCGEYGKPAPCPITGAAADSLSPRSTFLHIMQRSTASQVNEEPRNEVVPFLLAFVRAGTARGAAAPPPRPAESARGGVAHPFLSQNSAAGIPDGAEWCDGRPLRLSIVTGGGDDYFESILNLVASAQVHAAGTPVVVYDLGLSRERRNEIKCLRNVTLRTLSFSALPHHVRYLPTYAFKAILLEDAVRAYGDVLFLDAGMEINAPLHRIARGMESDGSFFTVQGCNMVDVPDVPCNTRDPCVLGDKSPPGFLERMFGLPRDRFRHHSRPCISAGIIGARSCSAAYARVIAACAACSRELGCINPPGAYHYVNSFPDQTCLSAMVHATGTKYHPGRRYNAALLSPMHVEGDDLEFLEPEIYCRRNTHRNARYRPYLDRWCRGDYPAVLDEKFTSTGPGHERIVPVKTRGDVGLFYVRPPAAILNGTCPDSEFEVTADWQVKVNWGDGRGTTVYEMDYDSEAAAPHGGRCGKHRLAAQANAKADGSGQGGAVKVVEVVQEGEDFEEEEEEEEEEDAGPVLSVVVVGRNDDYGGNFTQRSQRFVDQLQHSVEAAGVPVELVFVDYNPPAGRPGVAEVLRWPRRGHPLSVRVVTVPESVHRDIVAQGEWPVPGQEPPPLPLLEFVGKNIGIRRARGRSVLVTNPDILLGAELVRMVVASGSVRADSFYRIDRHDLRDAIPDTVPPAGLEAWAEANIHLIYAKHDLGIGRQFYEHGWASDEGRTEDDMKVIQRKGFVFLNVGADSDSYVRGYPRMCRTYEEVTEPAPTTMKECHDMAPGDFILMRREAWHRLRGFRELIVPSFMDSYMTYVAAGAGLTQRVLLPPYRIYHQKHDHDEVFGRIRSTPYNLEKKRKTINKMIRTGKYRGHINGEGWGRLGDPRIDVQEM